MATEPNSEELAATPAKRAVLFELENTAINGREITYGVVKELLRTRGVDFNEVAFSRYCVGAPLKAAVSELASGAAVGDALASGLAEAFDGSATALPGMKALLAEAARQGIALGALSSLPEEQAQVVAKQVGLLDAGGAVLSVSDDDKAGPTADGWLKLSKLVGVSPSVSIVLGTSSVSCKAALSAGMRCIVVPDPFTAFQDFGGTVAVFDALDAAAVKAIIAATEPA